MSDGAATDPQFNRSEHIDENVSAKRVASYSFDGTNMVRTAARFFSKPYDSVVLTYTDSTKATLSTAISKLSGVTQETITLTQASTTDTYTRT